MWWRMIMGITTIRANRATIIDRSGVPLNVAKVASNGGRLRQLDRFWPPNQL